MASAAASTKAYLKDLDGGRTVNFQFNPKEFKINDKANWKAGDEGTDKPLLTYEKGDPNTVSFDLVFDGTEDGTDVYAKYVEPLRGFLSVQVDESDAEGNKLKRPPFCEFAWGNFKFDCVVESLNATAIMFDSAGKVLRAKVTLNLKEHRITPHATKEVAIKLTGAGRSTTATAGIKIVQVQPGDTLTGLAPDNWREVAVANNIADPMNPPGGAYIAVGDLNSDLAAILGAEYQGPRGNLFSDIAIFDPGSVYAGPSSSSQGSSSFQDSPSAAPPDAIMHSAADVPGAGSVAGPDSVAPAAGRPNGARPATGRGRGRTAFDG